MQYPLLAATLRKSAIYSIIFFKDATIRTIFCSLCASKLHSIIYTAQCVQKKYHALLEHYALLSDNDYASYPSAGGPSGQRRGDAEASPAAALLRHGAL